MFRWGNRSSCLAGWKTHPTIIIIAPVGVRTHDLPHSAPSNVVKVSHAFNHSATRRRVIVDTTSKPLCWWYAASKRFEFATIRDWNTGGWHKTKLPFQGNLVTRVMTDKSSLSLLNVWWCQGRLMISYSRSRIYGWRVRKGVYCDNEQFDDVRNCDLVVGMSYKNEFW